MLKNRKEMENKSEEVELPAEQVERIDNVVRSGQSAYTSIGEFIEDAVEMKMLRFKATDKELERRIFSTLAKLKNNNSIERILEQTLREIWKVDNGDFKWTPEPVIELDGKWVRNPEFVKALHQQKAILWGRLMDGHRL